MRKLLKPVRAGRPGVSRIYRTRPALRVVAGDKLHRESPVADLSGLILYGQA